MKRSRKNESSRSTKNDKLKLAELRKYSELLSKYDVQGKSVLSQTFFFSLSLTKKTKISHVFFLAPKKKESHKYKHISIKNTYPNYHTY